MPSKKYCENCGITHTSLMCFNKPRLPLKKIGKKSKEWLVTRKEWIKQNPPDHQGYWFCIYCGCSLTYEALTLDHMYSRSRHSDRASDLTNLAPACGDCNSKKGSRDIDEFVAYFK